MGFLITFGLRGPWYVTFGFEGLTLPPAGIKVYPNPFAASATYKGS